MADHSTQQNQGSIPNEWTFRFEWVTNVDAPKCDEQDFAGTSELLDYLNDLRDYMRDNRLPKSATHDGLPTGHAKVIIFNGDDVVGEVDASEVRTDLRDGRGIRGESIRELGSL